MKFTLFALMARLIRFDFTLYVDEPIDPELKKALDALEGTIKTNQEEHVRKTEKLGEDSAELKEWKEKAAADMVTLTDSITEIKAAINRAPTGNDKKDEPSDDRIAFRKHLELGTEGARAASFEQKANLIVGDDERGGFLVTPEIGAMIDQIQQEISPMRSIVNVTTITSGDALESPTVTSKDAGATWRSEETTSTDQSDIKFGMKRIPVNWIDSVIPASQQAIDDISGLENMLAQWAAEDFAITEGAAIINGDGVGKPRGITTYASSDISQINSGASGAFTTTGILKLTGALKPYYRAGSSFITNRSTIFTYLFGLQDGEDRHYLVPDFSKGFQFTLLGFPLIEEPNMPNVAADSLSLAYGNFRRGYNWVERKQLSLFVDPFTSRPFTKFIWSKRSGGDVVVPEAIKLQKLAV
jgi:HK97 family phage major capsid protein